MKSTRIAVAAAMLAVLCVGLVAGIAQAGGLAKVTMLSTPKQVVAGKAIEVSFAVEPQFPMAKDRKVEPMVTATCGERVVRLNAVPLKTAGHYKAVFSLPEAGDWVITVDSRYCETRMKPLTLTAGKAKSAQS
jgi:hypothetical protein